MYRLITDGDMSLLISVKALGTNIALKDGTHQGTEDLIVLCALAVDRGNAGILSCN
jgi:hypothetical protein